MKLQQEDISFLLSLQIDKESPPILLLFARLLKIVVTCIFQKEGGITTTGITASMQLAPLLFFYPRGVRLTLVLIERMTCTIVTAIIRRTTPKTRDQRDSLRRLLPFLFLSLKSALRLLLPSNSHSPCLRERHNCKRQQEGCSASLSHPSSASSSRRYLLVEESSQLEADEGGR